MVVNSGDGNDSITVNGNETFEGPSGVTAVPVNFSVTAGNGNDTVAVTVDDYGFSGVSTPAPSIHVTVGSGNDKVTTYGAAGVEFDTGNGNDTLQSSQFQGPASDDGLRRRRQRHVHRGHDADVQPDDDRPTPVGGADTFENTDTDDTLQVNLGEGSDLGSEEFSISPDTAALTGTAFVDENGTGVYSSNDPVLPGATVYLDNGGDARVDSSDPSAVADAGGGLPDQQHQPRAEHVRGGTRPSFASPRPPGYTSPGKTVNVNFGRGGMSNVNPYVTPTSTRLTGTLLATAGSLQQRWQHRPERGRSKPVDLLRRAPPPTATTSG